MSAKGFEPLYTNINGPKPFPLDQLGQTDGAPYGT